MVNIHSMHLLHLIIRLASHAYVVVESNAKLFLLVRGCIKSSLLRVEGSYLNRIFRPLSGRSPGNADDHRATRVCIKLRLLFSPLLAARHSLHTPISHQTS